jgi:hypothetical protein
MTILARIRNQQVEILDAYEAGGEKRACIRALEGQPFVGGDRWPVHTEYTTAPAGELQDVHQDAPTLLDLALAEAKSQWHAGEAVTIWRTRCGKCGAFLKNDGGRVNLHLTGRAPYVTVFILTAGGWEVSRSVKTDYLAWVAKVQR